MRMPTAVITGCNNGIGFCLAQVALKAGYTTYATSRTEGPKLKELKEAGAKISTLDVSSMESIHAFKKSFGDAPIDLLINNAAIHTGYANEKLETITLEAMQSVYQTNTFGPLFLTQTLLPNLLASVSAKTSPHPTQVSHITTRAASMGDGPGGGSYAYRSSKAALNMIGLNMSADLKPKGIVVSLIHPGMINTQGFQANPDHPLVVSADYAAEKCWEIMMKIEERNTGKFWHREGQELPW